MGNCSPAEDGDTLSFSFTSAFPICLLLLFTFLYILKASGREFEQETWNAFSK